MTLICNNCFKHYKRRDYYNNHITLCKIINDRKLENENDKTPTCTELYSMIKDMGNKYTGGKNCGGNKENEGGGGIS